MNLKKENTSLKEQYIQVCTEKDKALHSLQAENDRLRSESQRLSMETTVLKRENATLRADLEAANTSLTDIKYWSVSHTEVRTTGERLGEGGWGKVEVGLLHGQRVALKTLHSEIVSPHYNDLVKREVAMMVKVRHPNLLLCIAAVLDHPSGSPIVITELMDTSLRKSYKDGRLDYKMKLCIMRDVASALDYLHCHHDQIIHRDVSSANVLLESRGPNKWRAKLSDFGSANIARLSNTAAPGAELYMAPEVPGNQTTKMDVFSYGVMSCELLTNQFPLRQAFPSMMSILYDNWPLMYQLVTDCTNRSPGERHDMRKVLTILYDNYSDVLID